MNNVFLGLLFVSLSLFSSDSAPIKGIATDIDQSKKSVEIFELRDEEIWKFKLKLSDVITLSPSGVLGPAESKVLSKKLSTFSEELPQWIDQASEELNRLMSLGVLIGQNKKIQREIIKSSKTQAEQLNRSKEIIKEISSLEKLIKSLIKKTNKHIQNLEKFRSEIERWDKYLIKTIRKDVGANLFSWNINNFIISPIKEIKLLVSGISYDLDISFQRVDEDIISKHLKPIIFMSIMLIFAMGIFLFIVDYTHEKFFNGFKYFHPTFGEILKKLFNDRLLLILLFYLFSWIKLVTSIIPDVPSIFNILTIAPILSYLWVRLGAPILNYIDSSGQNKSFTTVMIFFIFVKMTILNLSTESDALFILSSVLVMYLSYIIFRKLFRFTSSMNKEDRHKMSLLFRSGLFLTFLFCSLLFATGLLEIIGFGIFSRIVQGIVFNNLLTFFMLWALYHFINSVAQNYLKKGYKFFGKKKNYTEFIGHIISGINIFTVLAVFLFIIRSWSENIFIFDSIWDLKIFSIGGYNLTLWRPIAIVVCFYIIKGFYLITSYSIDSFWVYQLNISRKYSPNIKSLVKYFYVFCFFAICFGLLGFTYKNLVIFASALGVGIGFGLQNIVNNFISGIILLFERPIRVGDMIEVNSLFCRVCQIGIRSTIVETIDNSSIIIPNSEIISNRLTNWTLNSNIFAINCRVGVAYGSDTSNVHDILLNVLQQNPNILKNPEPQVWFEEFGDSSLNFQFRFSINEPSKKYDIRSEIMHEVNKSFARNGIKIPFPQRDIHVKKEDLLTT